jgi:hypothetical protein
MNSALLNTAIEYHRNSVQTIPLHFMSKRPLFKNPYNVRPYTLPELESLYYDKQVNIGAVCGAASQGLFVIDFDDRTTYKRYKETPELKRLLGHTPIVETKRGFHVWTRLDAEQRVTFKKINKIDFKQSGHVVAPISTGETGQLYLFIAGFDNIPVIKPCDLPFDFELIDKTALNEYAGTAGARSEIDADTRPYGVPEKLFTVLRGNIGHYPSRSEAEQALVTYLVNNEWSREHIHSLFSFHACKDTKYKERERKGHHAKYLNTCINNAFLFLQSHRTETDRFIDDLQIMSINPYLWKGRTGHTDKAVFAALVKIARQCGKREVFASTRELAELAGTTFKTVSNSLKRIKYVSMVTRAVDEWPAVWTFPTVDTVKGIIERVPNLHIPSHSYALNINNDLWRYKGAGKTGAAVYAYLQTVDSAGGLEISKAVLIPLRTVRRKLAFLSFVGLLEPADNGSYKTVKNPDYERAAILAGTYGAGQRQRLQHEAQRRAFKKYKDGGR